MGVDIGISTTKIVLADDGARKLVSLQAESPNQTSALYHAVEELIHAAGLTPGQVEKIAVTGVGAALAGNEIFGVPVSCVNELKAVGSGGLLLSGHSEALVMSVGTGTAFVHASGCGCRHVGGTGVGGGTLLGLAAHLLGTGCIDEITALAAGGDLSRVDLTVGDVSDTEIGMLSPDVTAANFGKNSGVASRSDLALGLLNLVFQTVGVMAAFACISTEVRTVVAVGSPLALPQAQPLLERVGKLFSIDFVIPAHARYATAMGAVSCILD